MTEQTLNVIITYTSDSADLEIDYTLGQQFNDNSQGRDILPDANNTGISFFLLADEISEGTEVFRVISFTQANTTSIDPPTTTFTSATISILDNDCEWLS